MKAGEITIKDTKVFRGLMERTFHPLLIDIILSVADKFGVVITESYREPRHSGDVHSTNPCRAIDIREWCYSDIMVKRVENYINNKWEYDHTRPEMKVALLHRVEGGTFHFHCQCHHRTRRK